MTRTSPPPDLEPQFGFLIADINRLLRKEFERRVRSSGLPRTHWLALAHLGRRDGCTVAALAENLQISRAAAARLAVRLERAGLVIRRKSEPGRTLLVHATPKGSAVLAELDVPGARLRDECFHGLPPERRAALLQGLAHVKANLLWLTTDSAFAPTRPTS